MRLRIIIGSIVTLAAAGVFAVTAARALWYAPEADVPLAAGLSEAVQPVAPREEPARFLIPKLGIDAAVQFVGTNAKGNMAAPNNFKDVGWYRYGTVPGQMGSAVIAGHVDNGLGLAGVFKRLAELGPGDEVIIATKEGKRLRFVVEESVSYPYDAAPADLLFNRSDKARLNLVTCEGEWLGGMRTYDKRRIVFAAYAGETAD